MHQLDQAVQLDNESFRMTQPWCKANQIHLPQEYRALHPTVHQSYGGILYDPVL